MAIYIIILLLLYLSVVSRIRSNIFVVIFWLVLFSLLISLRGYNVGTDTETYIDLYKNLEFGYLGYPEPLYGWLGYICNNLNFSFFQFQFLLCIIAFIPVFKTIIINKKYSILSIYLLYSLFFICYTMNINREMIACFVVLGGYKYLHNHSIKNNIKFFIFVFLAAGFHYSALFLLPIVLLNRVDLSLKKIVILFVLSLIVGLSISIDSLLPFVGKYADTLMEDMNYRDSIKILKGACLSFFFMIEFFYIRKISSNNMRNDMYMKIFALGIVLFNILIKQNYGMRLFVYFNIVQVVLLPLVLDNCIDQRNKREKILITYIGAFFMLMILINSADVVPYYLFF